jgi:drug/metabolite transporter (DMT)-like permease
MKRFLISLGTGFLVGFGVYLSQTLPSYFVILAHQPGRVPISEADSFSPNVAFTYASPLWIALWCVATALMWTVWTILKDGAADPKFPVRLLISYLLLISSIPTLFVLSDFDNLEATEEDWNYVLGWSYLLIGPVLAALYLALRNFRRMPVLAIFTALFALFHIGTTIADYGFYPQFVPDMDPGTPPNLGICGYLLSSFIIAIPFLAVYLIWKFWPNLKSRFARNRTDPSTSPG